MKLKTDIFGFGEVIKKQHPDEWKQVEKDWKDIFVDIPVEIEVKSTIRRTDKIGEPIRPGL